jgi:hypothetical protein
MTPNPPGTPPVLLTPAATTATTATTTFDGSITLSIAGQTYTLTGTLGNDLIVEYHADFAQAIGLGTVGDIATSIATAVGFPDLATEITGTLSQLETLPSPVGSVISELAGATVRITDLEINTQTKTYGVGLALDFTTSSSPPMLFGIALLSVGFKVTRVKTS